MRGFGEAYFDNRLVRNLRGAGGRKYRELPKLLRCVGDDFHVLSKQHHGIHGNGNRPAAEAEKPAEIDHDDDLTALVTNDATDAAEDILALDRAENFSTKKVADPNWLGESHGSRLRQSHARRWRHASRRRALRVRGAGGSKRAAEEQDAEGHSHQSPANHGKPFDSQYPPGYLLVTSIAVTHFGFL